MNQNPATSLIFGALALPLAYALFVLKPNWLLAVPATTLPIFVGLFGKALPLAVRLLTPLLGLLLIVVALILPDKLLFIRTGETRVVLPMTLFTIHADVIQRSMHGELAASGQTEERRQFLAAFLPVLDREMETARTLASYYPRLGFDPDYLMYRSTVFPFLEQEPRYVPERDRRFLREKLSRGGSHPAARLRTQGLHPTRLFLFPG